MTDITAFITAQLDTDEERNTTACWCGQCPGGRMALGRERARTIAAHRAIVAMHQPYGDDGDEDCQTCGVPCGCAPIEHPCDTLRHIAAIYRDRDGYQQEWAVET